MTNTVINYLNYREQVRANKEQEEIARRQLAESKRHALQTETISQFQQEEVQRHNIMGESLEAQKQSETSRHNYMTELLTNTANAINQRNVDLGYANLAFNQDKLSEDWNKFVLGNRLEQSKLSETERHNLAMESIQQQQVGNAWVLGIANLGYQAKSLQESIRHNQSTEAISKLDITSKLYSNTLKSITDIASAGARLAAGNMK